MLNPVEWEHLADALPDLQVALGCQNISFQVRLRIGHTAGLREATSGLLQLHFVADNSQD
jgi:hypothetical protein